MSLFPWFSGGAFVEYSTHLFCAILLKTRIDNIVLKIVEKRSELRQTNKMIACEIAVNRSPERISFEIVIKQLVVFFYNLMFVF